MSNIVSLETTSLPAYLQKGQVSAIGSAILGGLSTGESHPRISIKGARFRIVDGENEEVLNTLQLRTVIVGANPSITKVYYAKAFDGSEEAQSPECWSDNGINPAPSVTSPQNNLCASCPKNAWGSKITPQGKEAKACTDQKKLAVVSADEVDGTVYELTVTPAALKDIGKYAKSLAMRGIAMEAVVTVVGFDATASFPKLTFDFGGFLTEAEYIMAVDACHSDEAAAITHINDLKPQTIAAPAPVAQIPQQPQAAPQPQQQPVQQAAPQPQQQVVQQAAPQPVQQAAPQSQEAPVTGGFGTKKRGRPTNADKAAQQMTQNIVAPEPQVIFAQPLPTPVPVQQQVVQPTQLPSSDLLDDLDAELEAFANGQ